MRRQFDRSSRCLAGRAQSKLLSALILGSWVAAQPLPTRILLEGAGDVELSSEAVLAPEQRVAADGRLRVTLPGGSRAVKIAASQLTELKVRGSIHVVVHCDLDRSLLLVGSGACRIDCPNTRGRVSIHGDGASTFLLTRCDADGVRLVLEDSAKVDLMGSSDSLDIKVSGSASIEGIGLAAKAVHIRNEGSGLVRLGVLESLDADLYASGGVRAIKWKKLTQHRHGVGEVARAQ